MKKFLSLAILLVTLGLSTTAYAIRNGASEKTNDSYMVSLNYSGLEQGSINGFLAGTDYPIPRESDFELFRQKNILFIRLPIKWERVQRNAFGPLDTEYVGYIRQAVEYAEERGMTISLDVHNYGNYKGNKIGNGVTTQEMFADLWSKLATEFKDTPTITHYDLMNEPANFPNPQTWPDAAQAAINAIRLVDMDKWIMLEGNNYSAAYTWPQRNPTIHLVTDPADKIIFSAHGYLDRDNSGSHYIWDEEVAAGDRTTSPPSVLDYNIGPKRMQPFIDWLKKYGFRGNIGETGVGYQGQGWLYALDNHIRNLLDNNVTFTYWAAGPFFANYQYSVQPDGSGRDKVQWAVLTKYTNAKQPSVYFLDGPTSGPTGMASSNFTITYRGLIKAPITFTPSDNGAGGTFTPSSVTMEPDFNGTATFTYTAPSEQVYSISVTNDSGLTDPAPRGYATVADLFENASVQPNNIFWFSKIRAAYNGPALRLRRHSDNDTRDFGFTSIQLNAPLDTDAIAAWAGTDDIYVVRWYDQSANGYHMLPVNTTGESVGATPAARNSDQPKLILNCQNSKPCLRWEETARNISGSTTVDSTVITGLNEDATKIQAGTVIQWVQGFKADTVAGSNVLTNLTVNANGMKVGANVSGSGVSSGTTITAINSATSITISTNASATATQASINIAALPSGTRVVGANSASELVVSNAARLTLSPATLSISNGMRMDARSPVRGRQGFTIFSPFNSTKNNKPAHKLSWAVSDSWVFPDGGGIMRVEGEALIKMYIDLNKWNNHAIRYRVAPSSTVRQQNGLQVYKNGVIINASPTRQTTNQYEFGQTVNLGYFKYAPVYFTGYDGGNIIFPGALSDAEMEAFNQMIEDYYDTPDDQEPVIATPPPIDTSAPTEFPLVGVNLAGMEFGTTFYPTAAEAAYYRYMNMNVVRIPFKWERMQPVLSGPLDTTHLNNLKTVVYNMTQQGLNVVLDLHNYANYNSGSGAVPILDPGGPTEADFADFWRRMAQVDEFRNNAKVMFDLQNEPHSVTASEMATLANAAIAAIRDEGFTNYIHVEGGASFANCNSFISSGWGTAALTVTDPLDKVIFQCHEYLDANNSGTSDEALPGSGSTQLQNATTWARANGKKLFLGEFGVGYTDSGMAENADLLDFMIENNDVWVGWTAWGGGPAWPESYEFKFEPLSYTEPYAHKPTMMLLYEKRDLYGTLD